MSKRQFKRYFEWIGDTIYIRVKGENTTTKLDSLFEWYHVNQLNLYSAKRMDTLRDELHTLWDKHNRLLNHLGLEDVTEPEHKIILNKNAKLKETLAMYAPELNENQIKMLIRKIGEL